MTAISSAERVDAKHDASLRAIYLLRLCYFIWAVGLAVKIGPRFFPVNFTLPVMNNVVNAVLAGLSLTAFIGLRYPLRMLPLLFFEIIWKVVWLSTIGLPLWNAGPLDAPTTEVLKAIITVVVFPFLMPWRYVIENYIKSPGDRWK